MRAIILGQAHIISSIYHKSQYFALASNFALRVRKVNASSTSSTITVFACTCALIRFLFIHI